MRSHCVDQKGGTPQMATEYPAVEFVGAMTPEKALYNALTARMRERGSSE
jgi:hypothetical protein